MIKNTCRVCQQDLFEEPLLIYNNMPKSAQFLPDGNQVKTEKGMDIKVFQCAGCGLVQLNNAPVFYYKEVIRAAAVSQEMHEFRTIQFNAWINKYSLQEKKILEVGCGAGEYISMIPNRGVYVCGIEENQDSVDKCLNQGFDVEKGFIDNEKKILKNAPFDAFFMLNFLEHLVDPNATLKGIWSNLSDDAVGLVEVPNFDMILRQNLFAEFISDHLYYFTKDTFISTLNRNGFDVLECSEIWHDYSISAVVRKRKKTDLSSFYQAQQQLAYEIDLFLKKFSKDSVVIWGAGHQALAVMALTGLKGKIKYVVDSAEFKQNKYTPATHIPIVSPEMIKETSIEAVIVMAGSYSGEVVEIIFKEYGQTIKVAILEGETLNILYR